MPVPIGSSIRRTQRRLRALRIPASNAKRRTSCRGPTGRPSRRPRRAGGRPPRRRPPTARQWPVRAEPPATPARRSGQRPARRGGRATGLAGRAAAAGDEVTVARFRAGTCGGYDASPGSGTAIQPPCLRHPSSVDMAGRRAGLRSLVASPATTLAGRRDGVRASTMPSGRRHRSAQPTAVILLEVLSQMFARPSTLRVSDVVIRAGIVGLALATGYIHSTLGGLLFTLNAVGYVVAAIAMVIPLALAVRFRWVIRLGLMGYAATTIIGWAIQGPVLLHRVPGQGHRGRADRPRRDRLRAHGRQPGYPDPPRAGLVRRARHQPPPGRRSRLAARNTTVKEYPST